MMSPKFAKRAGFSKEMRGLSPSGWVSFLMQPAHDIKSNPQIYVLDKPNHFTCPADLRLTQIEPV